MTEFFSHFFGEEFEDHGGYEGTRNPFTTTWLISFQQISRDNKLATQILQSIAFLAESTTHSLLPLSEVDEVKVEAAIGLLKAFAFTKEQVV